MHPSHRSSQVERDMINPHKTPSKPSFFAGLTCDKMYIWISLHGGGAASAEKHSNKGEKL